MSTNKIVRTIDARPMLAAGEHPKALVIGEAARLEPGQTLELLTPFAPTPLIELLQQQGFSVIVRQPVDGAISSLITRT